MKLVLGINLITRDTEFNWSVRQSGPREYSSDQKPRIIHIIPKSNQLIPKDNVTKRPLHFLPPVKNRSRKPHSLPSCPRNKSKCAPTHRPHSLNFPLQNRCRR